MYLSTISSFALLIAKTLNQAGYDHQLLFRKAGLDPELLHDPNERYPVTSMLHLWDLCVEATQDPCFGLKTARYWHPTTLHALGYSWLASATLKDAFHRTARYSRILSTGAEMRLEEEDNDVMRFVAMSKIKVPLTSFQPFDAFMAILVKMCRLSCGEEFNPLRINLQRRQPHCTSEFSEYFRAPIQFSAPENSLHIDKALLDTPLPSANADLARANDKVITDYLAHLDNNDIVMQVKSRLINYLPSGEVSERLIANEMHISNRSMQRKLRNAGTTYTNILDETRRELASQYVLNSHLSMNEIAFLLGFSALSNFSRSFKRWTGVSPTAYRSMVRQHPQEKHSQPISLS